MEFLHDGKEADRSVLKNTGLPSPPRRTNWKRANTVSLARHSFPAQWDVWPFLLKAKEEGYVAKRWME